MTVSHPGRLGRFWQAFIVAGVVCVVVFFVVLGQYRETPPPMESTTSTTEPQSVPVFSYAIAGPAEGPFRPRGSTLVGTRVYVADSEGARLAILDLARGSEAELTYLPIAPDRPEDALPRRPEPTGVALLPDGVLLVADPANGRVWRITQDGALLGEFPEPRDRERSKLVGPVGLAVRQDEVYVTDVSDHRVKVYSTSGRFLRAFGGEGFRTGELSYPAALTVGADGLVWVADGNNRRVEVFDQEGAPLATLDETGSAEGMGLPRGVALDPDGRLHVVDAFGRVVYVYQDEGAPTAEYGRGPDDGALSLPEGITVTADRVVVSDPGNRRLAVFSYRPRQ